MGLQRPATPLQPLLTLRNDLPVADVQVTPYQTGVAMTVASTQPQPVETKQPRRLEQREESAVMKVVC